VLSSLGELALLGIGGEEGRDIVGASGVMGPRVRGDERGGSHCSSRLHDRHPVRLLAKSNGAGAGLIGEYAPGVVQRVKLAA
jgi:hypothetical protein